MEYQVLARKWRPMSFSDMVGQEHIAQTLQNALVKERTAHAYLFVGPRGIGKTTIARIFAKALNCDNAPTPEPCCTCESCLSIANGNNLDIIEIDGASNNGVNDIRNLREEVLFTPIRCKYKVYIIDEVHMLTNSAWNALLKTLEEPPPHVKFLFATTEPHKILPTVLSRCQRFDLQRFTEKTIILRLNHIAEAEGIRITPAALSAISRAANGGMRDALSLFDQIIAFQPSGSDSEISEERIFSVFGLTAPESLKSLVMSIISDDKAGVVIGIHKLAENGNNLEKLFDDILKFLRGIEICLLVPNPDNILEVGNDTISMYHEVGKHTSLEIVQKLLEHLSPIGKTLHDSLNKRVFLETSLLKTMRVSRSVKIEDLLARLNELRVDDLNQLDIIEAQTDITKAILPATTNLNPEENKTSKDALNSAVPEVKKPHTPIVKEVLKNETISNSPTEKKEVDQETLPEHKSAIKKNNFTLWGDSENEQERRKIKENKQKIVKTTSPEKPDSQVSAQKEQPQNDVETLNKKKPANLWDAMIKHIQTTSNSQLPLSMIEATVRCLENDTLIITYDENNNTSHIDKIRLDLEKLKNLAQKMTDNPNFNITLKPDKKEPVSIADKEKKLEETQKKVGANKFVKEIIRTFDGKLVDFRG